MPQLTRLPPTTCARSTAATRRPARAAWIAARSPPGPHPSTTTSKCAIARRPPWRRAFYASTSPPPGPPPLLDSGASCTGKRSSPRSAWALPFVAMLLAIAVLPLAAPHFWESNLRKLAVAALLAAPVLVLYLRARPEALVETAADYVSFIVLLGGLFVISGGILLEGDLEATPRTNAAFLGLGALLASFIGTTGRLDAPHPAAAADEPGAQARRAHGRLLHLPRVEHRRLPHAARRPAALPRLPARRAVPVDAAAVRPVALHRGAGARHLRDLGPPRPRARGGPRPAARLLRGAAAARRRQAEPRPARRRAPGGGLPPRAVARGGDRGARSRLSAPSRTATCARRTTSRSTRSSRWPRSSPASS